MKIKDKETRTEFWISKLSVDYIYYRERGIITFCTCWMLGQWFIRTQDNGCISKLMPNQLILNDIRYLTDFLKYLLGFKTLVGFSIPECGYTKGVLCKSVHLLCHYLESWVVESTVGDKETSLNQVIVPWWKKIYKWYCYCGNKPGINLFWSHVELDKSLQIKYSKMKESGILWNPNSFWGSWQYYFGSSRCQQSHWI